MNSFLETSKQIDGAQDWSQGSRMLGVCYSTLSVDNNDQHHSRGNNNKGKDILKNELIGEGESLYAGYHIKEHATVIFLRMILN